MNTKRIYILLILGFSFKIAICDINLNNSTQNDSNITVSNTTSNNSSSNSNGTNNNNQTVLNEYTDEFQYCYNLLNPTNLKDCNQVNYNYISCCFLNLTYPFMGTSCVPLDKRLAQIKQTKFNTFINSKITLPGEIFCDSRISRAVMLLLLVVIVIFI